MKNVRVKVESSQFPLTEITPVHSGKYSYTRENGKINYTHLPEDKIRLRKADYQLLKIMADFECEEVMIYVERLCNGVWVDYWSGFFTWGNVVEDLDQCWVDVQPKENDSDKCFNDNAKEDIGLFDLPIVATSQTAGTYETTSCRETFYDGDPPPEEDPENYNNACLPDPDKWCFRSYQEEYLPRYDPVTDTDEDEWLVTTTWQRETAPGTCSGTVSEPPAFGDPLEWELLSGGCEPGDDPPIFWRCPGVIVGPFTRGRLFNDVVERIVFEVCPDLIVKSDFFGINTVGDAPDNIAYDFAVNYLQKITMHQKSDVKRRNNSNGALAKAWFLTAEDFFEDLRKMLNVFYQIKDGVFILEHVSFFTSVEGLDLSDAPKKRILQFETASIYKREKFYWMDREYTGPFESNDIYNDCGEGQTEITLSLFTNDADYVSNPSNDTRVTDEGFVLIANAEVSGSYYPINGNDPFKWLNLHANLHLHGRAYKSGTINNVPVNFLSYDRYKKMEKFKATVCCSDNFNPKDEPTVLGERATVKSATEDLVAGKIEFELLF